MRGFLLFAVLFFPGTAGAQGLVVEKPQCVALFQASKYLFAKTHGQEAVAKFDSAFHYFESFLVARTEQIAVYSKEIREIAIPFLSDTKRPALEQSSEEIGQICGRYRKIADELQCMDFYCGPGRFYIE